MKRTLQAAQWTREPWGDIEPSRLLRFEVSATSFCHQMVRSIVGTLVDVGFGRLAGDSMPAVLAERHRNAIQLRRRRGGADHAHRNPAFGGIFTRLADASCY